MDVSRGRNGLIMRKQVIPHGDKLLPNISLLSERHIRFCQRLTRLHVNRCEFSLSVAASAAAASGERGGGLSSSTVFASGASLSGSTYVIGGTEVFRVYVCLIK